LRWACPVPEGGGTPGTRDRPAATGSPQVAWLGSGLATCMLAALAVWMAETPVASAAPAGNNGRIAFERHVADSADIYTVPNPGATPGILTPTNLTGTGALASSDETNPTWAQQQGDRGALAFESTLGGDLEIYTLELDPFPDEPGVQPQPRQFTSNTAPDTDPAWAPAWPSGDAPEPSPDDRPPIAFVRGGDIFVASYDALVESNVTAGATGVEGATLSDPDWSPNGQHIAFEATHAGVHEIWVMRISYVETPGGAAPGRYESSDFRPVTVGEPSSFAPSWFTFRQLPADLPPPSPDDELPTDTLPDPSPCPDLSPADCRFAPAERIAFSGVYEGDREILFASYEELDPDRPFADPAGITEWLLTDNAVDDAGPSWSPSGGQIVFERPVAGAQRLHLLSQDGEFETQLPIDEGNSTGDRNPAWEPTFLGADVITRRPCGRYSTRPRCRRIIRAASVQCPSGTPPDCVASETCPSGAPPPCTTPQCPSGAAPPCPTPPPQKCTQTGTRGPDLLRGTAGRDVLCGGRGNDRLIGAAGNDVLRGGLGKDRLRGGPGRDRLYGEENSDWLDGGTAADRLYGGSAGDRLIGGAGRDRLVGEAGPDRIAARDGQRDVVRGGSGQDIAILDRAGDVVSRVELLRRP
jgi:hypothetical protein